GVYLGKNTSVAQVCGHGPCAQRDAKTGSCRRRRAAFDANPVLFVLKAPPSKRDSSKRRGGDLPSLLSFVTCSPRPRRPRGRYTGHRPCRRGAADGKRRSSGTSLLRAPPASTRKN